MIRELRIRNVSYLLFLAVVALFLGGCNGRIEGFDFVDRRGGEATTVVLRDPDRLEPEEEPFVRETPRRLLFQNPLIVSEDRTGFYIRYTGGSSGSVTLTYEVEEDRTHYELRLPKLPGFALPVRYYADLPPGSIVELLITPGTEGMEIIELGLSPFEQGFELGAEGVRLSEGYDAFRAPAAVTLLGPPGDVAELQLESDLGEQDIDSPAKTRLRLGAAESVEMPEGLAEPSLSDGGGAPALSEATHELRLLPGRQRVSFLSEEPGSIAVTLAAHPAASLRSFRTRTLGPGEPIPADMSTILAYPRSRWRNGEYELFRWSTYPRVLLIDSGDYGFQSRMFKRLAFFVEKEGFRGRLLTNDELQGRHGWNAHNYNPRDLASFFSLVEERGFVLNREEMLLRGLLLENDLIFREGDGSGYRPGEGGILTISQESYPLLRELLLTHEALHGIYYEEPGFRERVRRLWEEELSDEEREFWRFFLSYMSYDPADDYLMMNEMQAYLLQYPLSTIPGYFRGRIGPRLRAGRPDRREYVDQFFQEYPDSFRSASAALNDYLFRETGFIGGDFLLLRELDR